MVSTSTAESSFGSLMPVADPPDDALMVAFQNGNQGAFDVLFLRYRDRATSYAWRMLGRREEAEEIVVEAFARVLDGAWRPTGSFGSFLFTVVHRLCLDRLRRRTRANRGDARIEAEPGPPPSSPYDAAEVRERSDHLDAALATLPETYRSVLLLYYGQELSSKEVAAIVGCEDQQVRSMLAYARRLLRERLGDGEVS
jgi:RNA polymerase sigma factor (sigma-70 family)